MTRGLPHPMDRPSAANFREPLRGVPAKLFRTHSLADIINAKLAHFTALYKGVGREVIQI